MIKSILIIILTSCTLNKISTQDIRQLPIKRQIKPFTSDGCSFFPEGTNSEKQLWLKCCIIHDYKYWMGGTKKEREFADKELKSCVKNLNYDTIAKMMYIGTRIGGHPDIDASFSWGYGWKYKRGYKALSKVEIKELNKKGPKKGEDLRKYILENSGSMLEVKLNKKIIF